MGQFFIAVFLADDAQAAIGHAIPQHYGSFGQLVEHGWIGDPFALAVERFLATPARVVWAGEHADPEAGSEPTANLYWRARSAPLMPECGPGPVGRYVVDHDTHRYIDKIAVPLDRDGQQVHPLVALTAEGCTFGLGDFGYHRLIGTWARHRVQVTDIVPNGYRELAFPLNHRQLHCLYWRWSVVPQPLQEAKPVPAPITVPTVSRTEFEQLAHHGLAGDTPVPESAPAAEQWRSENSGWRGRHWAYHQDELGVLRLQPLNVARSTRRPAAAT
ncbi:hypothetical protein ABIA39_004509 [Nocardia sp. GAS34]|uniref:hypothetical protein n=1 Tax=unclassified Nocardia TaxID=2637762 RepID=UPI003D1D0D4D